MSHMISRKVLALGALALASVHSVASDQLIAVLDLKYIKETEQVAALQCFVDPKTGAEDACYPHAYQYLWSATVRQVLSGSETEKQFLLLYGRHALMKRDLDRVTLLMERIPGASAEAPRYRAIESGWHREIACFTENPVAGAPLALVLRAGHKIDCFDIGHDQ